MFLQVKTIRLVGILLIVFVKNEHLRYVSKVDAETVATGIMGLKVREQFDNFVFVLPKAGYEGKNMCVDEVHVCHSNRDALTLVHSSHSPRLQIKS